MQCSTIILLQYSAVQWSGSSTTRILIKILLLHCTACTAVHCTKLHCTALHSILPNFTALQSILPNCTALHRTDLNCTEPHSTKMNRITFYSWSKVVSLMLGCDDTIFLFSSFWWADEHSLKFQLPSGCSLG